MIRRHLTPAVVSFLPMLACCLAAPAVARLWWAAAALAVAGAGASIAALRGPWRRPAHLVLSVAVGLFLGAASMLRMDLARGGSFLPAPAAEISGFTGTVTQDSTLTTRGDTVARLQLEEASSIRAGISGRARGALLLFVSGDTRLCLGQRIRVHAGLAEADRFGPERWSAAARRADVTSLGFSGAAWAFRSEARPALHRAVSRVGYPASALLEALLIGVREDVPADLYDRFQRTGSLHILALSGLHVTVLYAAAAALLWLLRRRWQRFLLAIAAVLFFQFLAGFMPSLLRATLMIAIGGVSILLDRDREPINVLALSGVAILLVDPFQGLTLSFQLSYLALFGILALGALVERPLSGSLPRFLLAALAMSTGAQAATLPLVISAFGAWYPSGLLASLLLVPLTTAYLWAGLAWLVLFQVPWPAMHDAAAAVFGVCYRVIDGAAEAFSRIPGFVVAPAAVPWLAAALAVVIALAATVLPLRRRTA